MTVEQGHKPYEDGQTTHGSGRGTQRRTAELDGVSAHAKVMWQGKRRDEPKICLLFSITCEGIASSFSASIVASPCTYTWLRVGDMRSIGYDRSSWRVLAISVATSCMRSQG
jgi:hypothetical protein